MSNRNDRATWILGNTAQCSVPPAPLDKPLRFVLLGTPGVGKGTQAELLHDRLGTCQLSTGDIFRAAKCQGEGQRSPAMEDALGYMRRGELVPDATVLALVRERTRCLRCRGGFLLDGFPRTVAQAEALADIMKHEGIEFTAVLNYELPVETIVARLSGRRTCSNCKAVYHTVTRAPRVPDKCDHCGAVLVQREDDRPDAVRVRMKVYESSTRPLIDYYQQRGLLKTISAEGAPEEIFARTLQTLGLAATA